MNSCEAAVAARGTGAKAPTYSEVIARDEVPPLPIFTEIAPSRVEIPRVDRREYVDPAFAGRERAKLWSGEGSVPKITCPFHAFRWSLDGKLDHIPSRWDFPEIGGDDLPLNRRRWRSEAIPARNMMSGPISRTCRGCGNRLA